ncbi:MAG TPA: endonuclease/exonuclease/phosphatase family protein [Actinomycetales bacterium]|nr:endonuclease/exonuclease/phosphatase family protein [Actinomycetales bacterium]
MSPRSWLAPTLLTVMTLAVIDSMRFSGPLIDAAFTESTALAATLALTTYAAVVVPVAILALTGLRGRLLRATGISVILYVIARAAMQLFGDSLYPAALGVTTISLASWVLCLATVRYAFSARKTVSAILGGIALSITSQLLLGTWDLAWRTDLLALVLLTFGLMGLFLLGSFAITKQAAGPDLTPSRVRISQLWPLGPWLALVLMVFANPAFLASQSGFALGWSGAFLIGACAIGISLLSPEETQSATPLAPVESGWRRTVAALIGFVGGITAAFILDGVTSFIAVIVALLSSIPLLLDVLTDHQSPAPELAVEFGAEALPRPGIGVLSGAGLLIGTFTVVPVLLFQLDYDIPLPVPNFVVITLTAAALGLAALWAIYRSPAGWRGEANDDAKVEAAAGDAAAETSAAGVAKSERENSGAVTAVSVEKLGGGALLLVALLAGLMAPSIPDKSADNSPGTASGTAATGTDSETGAAAAGADMRVLSWNLHYGVSAKPRVALDDILDTISAEDPDVVLLQEVSRGWVLAGGSDMLTWLASGLNMTAAWSPAADGQFGNVVLSKYPLTEVRAQRLPYGAGPQKRSFVSATVAHPLTDVQVTSTHLQHRVGNAKTRLEQVDSLLEYVDSAENNGATILGGDFNAEPDSLEIETLTAATWLSTLDAVGNAEQNTSPSHDPAVRIDWLFTGSRLQTENAEVLSGKTASDHLPLVADLTVLD